MNKQEINTKIDNRIKEIFSTPDFYDSIRESGVQAYNKYRKEKNKEESFVLLSMFIEEELLKSAISTSMKEIIDILVEEGIISE